MSHLVTAQNSSKMEEATKNASVGAGWWTGGSWALPGLGFG